MSRKTQNLFGLACCLSLLGALGQPGFCAWTEPSPELRPETDTGHTTAVPPPNAIKVETSVTEIQKTVTETSSGQPVETTKKTTTESTQIVAVKKVRPEKVRHDKWIAYRMAKDLWVDRECLAEPGLVEAICAHPGPAAILAKHPHIADIAEADPYLCRRLTKWHKATFNLIKNPNAISVITKDPDGIYEAIKRKPKLARILAKNSQFNQMIDDNPELGRFIAGHM